MHGTLHIDVASWTIRLRVGPKLGEQLEPKWLRIIVSSISVRINIISVFNIISIMSISISIITSICAIIISSSISVISTNNIIISSISISTIIRIISVSTHIIIDIIISSIISTSITGQRWPAVAGASAGRCGVGLSVGCVLGGEEGVVCDGGWVVGDWWVAFTPRGPLAPLLSPTYKAAKTPICKDPKWHT